MQQPPCPLMIGVSTAQNSTNLLPFLRFNGDRLLLLETNLARDKKWSSGFADIATGRGKTFDTQGIGEGLDLESTLKAIRKGIEAIDQPIAWNVGGGQKMQTLAIMTMFQERLEKGCQDWLCYAEPQTRKTFLIQNTNGSLQSHDMRTSVADLTLREINQAFGYRNKTNKEENLLWQRREVGSGLQENNLLTSEQFDFFLDYKKRQDMMRYTLDRHENKKNTSDPRRLFGDLYNEKLDKKNGLFGHYFEKMVQTAVARLVDKAPASHRINEIRFGEIQSIKTEADKQEFDVLLVTDFGTLIALDAKTYEFGKKDEDARTHNLFKASGLYTEFCSVFPFSQADLKQADSLLNGETEWKNLRNRPFEIEKRKGRMFAFCEETTEEIKLEKGEKSLKLNNLGDMLTKLKLLAE